VAAPLYEGAVVSATAAQAHYLAHVMRRSAGDAVRLFNGSEGEWEAAIAGLRREQGSFAVSRRVRPQAAEPDLWLAFAVLKRDATELVVRQATEMGTAVIQPVLTAHTNAAHLRLERLAAIATEAAEQCERLSVPVLHPALPLPALLDRWPVGRRLAVAVERTGAPAAPVAAGGLLVGPEGGFGAAELDGLRPRPFVVPLSLGPRILRAETAVVAGLSLLQAAWSGAAQAERGQAAPGPETVPGRNAALPPA